MPVPDIISLPVGRKKWRHTATAVRCVEQVTVHVRGCTGTKVDSKLIHARTCCSPVTTLCRFQCGVAETCTLADASGCSCLWPPCVAGADIIFLPCGYFFLSSSFFFPRLISAVADWMSTILLHMVWPQCEFRMQVCNVLRAARWKYRTQKRRKKSPSAHHRTTCRDVFSQLRHESTIGKNFKQQYLLHMSS